MKLTVFGVFTVLASVTAARGGPPRGKTFQGDIVAYWNERLETALNNSSPRLSSLRESYIGALVHTSILAASDDSEKQPRAVRQLAISHAAHDTLVRVFTAQYRAVASYVRAVEDTIDISSRDRERARAIGEYAAKKVYISRAGDNVDKYFRYEWQKPGPGVYRPTPPSFNVPADPAGKYIKPFGGIKSVKAWRPPPNPRSKEYVKFVKQIKEKGARTGSTRTPEETEIGYYWLESSVTWWNRFARLVAGDRFKDDISGSAKFYALLNWSIANSGIVGFITKEKYNSWRPETALHYDKKYLWGGQQIYDPNWVPLAPTPVHQDYLSGHAVYGAGAARIIQKLNGGDRLRKPISIGSNVTLDNVGWITRTYRSIHAASVENADSRVFVGVHFQFASDEGIKAAYEEAERVWKKGTKDYL